MLIHMFAVIFENMFVNEPLTGVDRKSPGAHE